jgi:DNA-binding NtrC family response regulator
MDVRMRALLVTAGQHAREVTKALESYGTEVDRTYICREARAALERDPEYDVIVSDVSLIDGNWWTISRELTRLSRHTELVVYVPPEDWASQCTFSSTRGLARVLTPPFDRASIESLFETIGAAGA